MAALYTDVRFSGEECASLIDLIRTKLNFLTEALQNQRYKELKTAWPSA